jgi:hypothetical protein
MSIHINRVTAESLKFYTLDDCIDASILRRDRYRPQNFTCVRNLVIQKDPNTEVELSLSGIYPTFIRGLRTSTLKLENELTHLYWCDKFYHKEGVDVSVSHLETGRSDNSFSDLIIKPTNNQSLRTIVFKRARLGLSAEIRDNNRIARPHPHSDPYIAARFAIDRINFIIPSRGDLSANQLDIVRNYTQLTSRDRTHLPLIPRFNPKWFCQNLSLLNTADHLRIYTINQPEEDIFLDEVEDNLYSGTIIVEIIYLPSLAIFLSVEPI